MTGAADAFTLVQTAMDRDLLQELARVKIRAKRLPDGAAVGIRETRGDGRPCDLCEDRIDSKQRAVLVMVSLEWMSVCFHVPCYEVWTAERARVHPDGHGPIEP